MPKHKDKKAYFGEHHPFENPNVVTVKDFNGAKLSGGKLNVTLPAKSVVLLEFE